MNLVSAIIITILGCLPPGMELQSYDSYSSTAVIEVSEQLSNGTDGNCEIVFGAVEDILRQSFPPKKVLLVSKSGWVPLGINPATLSDIETLRKRPRMAWGE